MFVAHNSKFDAGKIQARCLVHGLPPPSPFVQYDTLRAVKKVCDFSDNRLASLAIYLDLPHKLDSGGKETWMNILRGDAKSKKAAWVHLKLYNAGDIRTLEALYLKIAPWDAQHPKRSYFTHNEECDVCASKHLESRGWKKNKSSITRRLHCKDCGHYQLAKPNVRVVAA